ncbi:hypothetical protein B0I73DRAFT_34609 [Yarrowia lipolytica]|uniref:YALI0E29425p n=2 Tax=Yarrowia lipolytica TaxID=4952 RepID=Q6C461_YARLI|nr:YALI0E29425p [Yarrowia lipolytica CLIB122]AOW06132.1 hypothetical protein YALI1_E34798g [Yarrowia lipolytica]KAB8285594.1 hypothetical protein BKA91DRAFT_35390 [Yarrowia lipolytica]KAE8175318.1 hypothetical protein BKA90DRAFT_637 [Yarrowia lipolytica]KAJ8057528.1 hypothetical protein LXG23DRAFT_54227 [Yarrowia lipolytica]QNP99273.1 Hypothetical protein YALI2_E00589g [Yarrowia lipolytica]|eukprot:XP_504551.1 YALI0E29425p [Yarrowia lipolytica CLIB122]
MLGFKSTYAEYLQFNNGLNAYLSRLGNEALWLKRCSVALVATLAARHVLCPINDNDTDETLLRLASVMEANSRVSPQQRPSVSSSALMISGADNDNYSETNIYELSQNVMAYILSKTDGQLRKLLEGISEPLDASSTIKKAFKLRRRREVKKLFSQTVDHVSTLRIKRDKRSLAIFVQHNLKKFRQLDVSLLDGCNALLGVDDIEDFEWLDESDSVNSFQSMFVPEDNEEVDGSASAETMDVSMEVLDEPQGASAHHVNDTTDIRFTDTDPVLRAPSTTAAVAGGMTVANAQLSATLSTPDPAPVPAQPTTLATSQPPAHSLSVQPTSSDTNASAPVRASVSQSPRPPTVPAPAPPLSNPPETTVPSPAPVTPATSSRASPAAPALFKPAIPADHRPRPKAGSVSNDSSATAPTTTSSTTPVTTFVATAAANGTTNAAISDPPAGPPAPAAAPPTRTAPVSDPMASTASLETNRSISSRSGTPLSTPKVQGWVARQAQRLRADQNKNVENFASKISGGGSGHSAGGLSVSQALFDKTNALREAIHAFRNTSTTPAPSAPKSTHWLPPATSNTTNPPGTKELVATVRTNRTRQKQLGALIGNAPENTIKQNYRREYKELDDAIRDAEAYLRKVCNVGPYATKRKARTSSSTSAPTSALPPPAQSRTTSAPRSTSTSSGASPAPNFPTSDPRIVESLPALHPNSTTVTTSAPRPASTSNTGLSIASQPRSDTNVGNDEVVSTEYSIAGSRNSTEGPIRSRGDSADEGRSPKRHQVHHVAHTPQLHHPQPHAATQELHDILDRSRTDQIRGHREDDLVWGQRTPVSASRPSSRSPSRHSTQSPGAVSHRFQPRPNPMPCHDHSPLQGVRDREEDHYSYRPGEDRGRELAMRLG